MASNNMWDLKKEDFPVGVPVFKVKHDLFYKPNNCGYTNNILEAGLYEREEGLDYCFGKGDKNGRWEVCAMPIWMAVNQKYISKEKLKRWSDMIAFLSEHTDVESFNTVTF